MHLDGTNVFHTLPQANICLTAHPDVDIQAWLGPTNPRSRSRECRAQIEGTSPSALHPESSAVPTGGSEVLGGPLLPKFSPMAALGTEILSLTKHSSGVKLHSFLGPLSCKSPFHLKEILRDALLEATRVHSVGEAGSTHQARPMHPSTGPKPRPSPLTYSRPLLREAAPLPWTAPVNAQLIVNAPVVTSLPPEPHASPLYSETPVIQGVLALCYPPISNPSP